MRDPGGKQQFHLPSRDAFRGCLEIYSAGGRSVWHEIGGQGGLPSQAPQLRAQSSSGWAARPAWGVGPGASGEEEGIWASLDSLQFLLIPLGGSCLSDPRVLALEEEFSGGARRRGFLHGPPRFPKPLSQARREEGSDTQGPGCWGHTTPAHLPPPGRMQGGSCASGCRRVVRAFT